jgi:peptide-methionine (R)-S-oxide reductase
MRQASGVSLIRGPQDHVSTSMTIPPVAAAILLTLAIAACAATSSEATPPTPGPTAPIAADTLPKTDAEWKARLAQKQYYVLREHGTEAAFSGAFWNNHEAGVYHCAGCGEPLYDAADKYESGTGWPSFTKALAGKVATGSDSSHGMERTEVHCARCGGHLGHVFDDGPGPTGKRYCMNSAAMTFEKAAAKP